MIGAAKVIWLDHMQYQPLGFRTAFDNYKCRVDFQEETEARSFARAFGGRVLS